MDVLPGLAAEGDAAEAAGLISEVVPDGTALEHATNMALRIAKNSPLAVALAKDAALQSMQTSLASGLEHEKRNFRAALSSSDSLEGQDAFLNKRKPHFTGK